MFGAIRPSSQRAMGMAVKAVVAMVVFGVHSVQAGETIVKPDQAYSCTALTSQRDSLNCVDRLVAGDGTYIAKWARCSPESRGRDGTVRRSRIEYVSFGRWKADSAQGFTLATTEEARYRTNPPEWTTSNSYVLTEAVAATGADGTFESKAGNKDYMRCQKADNLTAEMLRDLKDSYPKAVEAKNVLTQRSTARQQEAASREAEESKRYPGMSPRQIAEQDIMKLQRRIVAYESRGGLPPQCQGVYNSMTRYYRSALESMAWAEKTGTDSMFKTASTTARLGVDLPTQGCP